MSTEMNTQELPGLLKEPTMFDVQGVPVLALPPNWTAKECQHLLGQPRFIQSKIVAHDVRGFNDYVIKHKLPETAIYAASPEHPSLIARIDDNATINGETAPSHVAHTCTFPCPLTHEWKQWLGKNDKPMSQIEFAEFIENNLLDIVEPDGAGLLTACLSFQDTGSAEFKSAVRLSDGRIQFQYIEKDATGELKFPERLVLALPVFEGLDVRFRMAAKLRYRVDRDAGLHLRYVIERPDLALKDAYSRLIEVVTERTSLPVIRAI